MTVSRALAIASLVALLAVPTAAAAPPESSPNIRIVIEIGRIDGGKKVSVGTYQMTRVASGESTALNVGTRLPLPVDRAQDGSNAVSFTYQNVGLTVKLRAATVENRRIQVTGDLSASLLRDAVPSHPSPGGPSIGTVSQDVNVIVRPGKPVRLLSVEEPGIGSFYVELSAEPED
jgi:hypothetical protein